MHKKQTPFGVQQCMVQRMETNKLFQVQDLPLGDLR